MDMNKVLTMSNPETYEASVQDCERHEAILAPIKSQSDLVSVCREYEMIRTPGCHFYLWRIGLVLDRTGDRRWSDNVNSSYNTEQLQIDTSRYHCKYNCEVKINCHDSRAYANSLDDNSPSPSLCFRTTVSNPTTSLPAANDPAVVTSYQTLIEAASAVLIVGLLIGLLIRTICYRRRRQAPEERRYDTEASVGHQSQPNSTATVEEEVPVVSGSHNHNSPATRGRGGEVQGRRLPAKPWEERTNCVSVYSSIGYEQINRETVTYTDVVFGETHSGTTLHQTALHGSETATYVDMISLGAYTNLR